jgi:hypothetical protein
MQGLGPQSTKSHDTKAGRLHDGMSIRPTVGDLQEDEELGQNRKSARQKIERRVMATGLAVGRAHTSGIPVSLLDLQAPPAAKPNPHRAEDELKRKTGTN